MNEFENIIKECLYKEFGYRIEKYGYFDAKDVIELDRSKLELELKNEKYENFKILEKYRVDCIKLNKKNKISNNGCVVGLDYDEIEKSVSYGEEFFNKFLYLKNIRLIDANDLNYIIKFYNNYNNKKIFKIGIELKYVLKLILLLFFNNIDLFSNYINLRKTIHSILNPIEAVMQNYLDNDIKQLEYNNHKLYIFYIESRVKIEIICNIQKFFEYIKDANNYYFRGHSKVNYKLLPSSFREKSFDEKKEIDNICAEYPNLFNALRRIDILSRIQHYGGKTRLLDITENPLVALYFACCNSINEMGEIVVFTKKKEYYSTSDTLSMLSALSFLDNEKINELRKIVNNHYKCFMGFFINNKVIYQLEHLIRQESAGFKFANLEALNLLNDCIYYKANMAHERIVRQSGRFILCGIDANRTENFLNNLRKEDDCGKKIIYLVSNKGEIKRQLKTFGIDNHYLFPEIQNYFINSHNESL